MDLPNASKVANGRSNVKGKGENWVKMERGVICIDLIMGMDVECVKGYWASLTLQLSLT